MNYVADPTFSTYFDFPTRGPNAIIPYQDGSPFFDSTTYEVPLLYSGMTLILFTLSLALAALLRTVRLVQTAQLSVHSASSVIIK